jgi:hypothetical protein
MEQKAVLKRSPKGLQAQIITSGILALLLALVSNWVLDKLFGWTPNEGGIIKTIALVVIIGGWAITSLKLWLDWKVKLYEITKDALIVHAKAGKWGSSQTIYRYESIISIRMSQGFWGKRYNFGDVFITIPKIDKEVVMNDIQDPLEQLTEVQQRMNERGAGAQALVT